MYCYSSCHDSAMSLFFHTPVQEKKYSASLVTGCLKTNLTHWFYCSAAVSHSCLYLSETVKKKNVKRIWVVVCHVLC